MRNILSICLIAAIPFMTSSWAVETVVKGEVLEVKDIESYTYIRLKTKSGETWAAVPKTSIKKGAKVTLDNVMEMKDFESHSLKKTFPSILFATLGGPGTPTAAPHSAAVKVVETGPINVPKATGANARTVAEIIAKATDLKDKPIQVRGKVVKYTAEIMGKNWIHLRDGSGNEADASNDIIVTTKNTAKTGDVVTVSGLVRTNKDFGSGYTYKVMIEEATLQP